MSVSAPRSKREYQLIESGNESLTHGFGKHLQQANSGLTRPDQVTDEPRKRGGPTINTRDYCMNEAFQTVVQRPLFG